MPVYTPPALNAVDFALVVQPAHSVDPYDMALSVYTVPALNAVDFALVTYTQPVYNTIDFELLGGTNWTLNLSDTITLSDAIVKGVGKFFADNITLSDQLSGITPQGGRIRTYRFFWLKIYVCTLEGRNVFRITIFD